ncbi:MAG: hypothetical protein Q8R15_00275 [Candidatus Micrarchaeota archaeon]|nr:hypothetical protein [Candidatus Micrarchaeota archaeon]
MAMLRTTILIEEVLALRVRQMFNGNLTQGINALLQQHLHEGKRERDLGFGALKGQNLVEELMKTRRAERKRGER